MPDANGHSQGGGTADTEPDRPDDRWDFAVSYQVRDRGWAEWIAWQLDALGYRVSVSAWEDVPGSARTARLDAVVRGAQRVLVVLSGGDPDPGTTEEWGAALRRDPQGRRRLLIPIRVEDCAVEGLLGSRIPIDLFGLTAEQALVRLRRRIADAVKGQAKPDVAPPYPSNPTGRPPSHPATSPTPPSSALPPSTPPSSAPPSLPTGPAPPFPAREPGLGREASARRPGRFGGGARPAGYQNFDLVLQRTGSGTGSNRYRVRAVGDPVGVTAAEFASPFPDSELQQFLIDTGHPRRLTRRGNSQVENRIRSFGTTLFDTVFSNGVRASLVASTARAFAAGQGLRLRLGLVGCPELADLPWEYLFDQATGSYLALSEWTPVIRYHVLPRSPADLPELDGPLRVLVQIASPAEAARIDAEREFAHISSALRATGEAGRVQITRVPGGSVSHLQDALRQGEYHVFHFIGHGDVSESRPRGSLLFEGRSGSAQWVDGGDLLPLLGSHHTLRLAVLNACEGARGSRVDPFGGVAQALVRGGLPAVVAMQFEITDDAALVFARELYEAVADNDPIEAAVAEARKALHHELDGVEWGTPVLHIRGVAGGETAPAPSAVPERMPPTPAKPAPATSAPATPAAVKPAAVKPAPVKPGPVTTRPSIPGPAVSARPHSGRATPRFGPAVVLALLSIATLVLVLALLLNPGPGSPAGPTPSPVTVTGVLVDGNAVTPGATTVVRGITNLHTVTWITTGAGDTERLRTIVEVVSPQPGDPPAYLVGPPEQESPAERWSRFDVDQNQHPTDQIDRLRVLLILADQATTEALDDHRPATVGSDPLPAALMRQLAGFVLSSVILKPV